MRNEKDNLDRIIGLQAQMGKLLKRQQEQLHHQQQQIDNMRQNLESTN